MPSSFLTMAQDFNGDGRNDIWNSDVDVLASIAHFLKQRGSWQAGQPWGEVVVLPKDTTSIEELIETKQWLPLSKWRALGISSKYDLDESALARVIRLPGDNADTYLVYANFKSIYAYNPRTLYAFSVCLLADKIK